MKEFLKKLKEFGDGALENLADQIAQNELLSHTIDRFFNTKDFIDKLVDTIYKNLNIATRQQLEEVLHLSQKIELQIADLQKELKKLLEIKGKKDARK